MGWEGRRLEGLPVCTWPDTRSRVRGVWPGCSGGMGSAPNGEVPKWEAGLVHSQSTWAAGSLSGPWFGSLQVRR